MAKIWAFFGAPGFFTAPRCTSRCHLWNKISPWQEKALQQPFPLSFASCTLLLSSSRDHTACCLVSRVQPHLGKDAAISTPLKGYFNLYRFQSQYLLAHPHVSSTRASLTCGSEVAHNPLDAGRQNPLESGKGHFPGVAMTLVLHHC